MAVKVTQHVKLRRLEIEIAMRERAERGGLVFANGDFDVSASGTPTALVKLTTSGIEEAIRYALAESKLVQVGDLVWGVDEEGIFVECDVEPKPKRPRKAKGA